MTSARVETPEDFPQPWSGEEWEQVIEAGFALVNATAHEHDPRYPEALEAMRSLIADLRARYGEHPILIETLADFEDGPDRRIELYGLAIERATALGRPTASIRMSLAKTLVEYCGKKEEALVQLRACADEVMRNGDEHDKNEHAELVSECETHAI